MRQVSSLLLFAAAVLFAGCQATPASPLPADLPMPSVRTITGAQDTVGAPLAPAVAPAPTAIPDPALPPRPDRSAPQTASPTPVASATATPPTGEGGPVSPAPVVAPQDAITAEAYLIMEAETGKVLVEQRGRERRAVASLTKVMTALVVLESMNLDDIVTVGDEVWKVGRGSTLMGVQPGEKLTVRDLLYGLMLPSGNDAALVLAEHLPGGLPAFITAMNQRAAEVGLRDTRFSNPHGLDDRGGNHYSTAYDMARLARVAMAHPTFREIVAAETWKAKVKDSEKAYDLINTNPLLGYYPGTDGVKIGFTGQAGQTFIASVVREGRRLLIVVLGSKQRATDTMRLLEPILGPMTS